jgi:biopolymer transport protein ExbB
MKTMRVPSGRSWGWAAAPVLLANLVLGGAAFAAQAAGGAAEAASRFDFFTIWILGGGGVGFLFVLPIELCSVAAVASIIEHLVSIQRDRLVPPEMVVDLEALLDEGQLEEAGALCETRPNYLTAIVGAALARSAEGYDAMMEAAEGVADEQNLRLQHKISWLNLFSNVGPLLGLLGTVVGMVMAFSQIAMSSTPPTPQELALGIFTALVTTVWGLLVAIPASSAYFYFKVRIQRITFELSGVAMEIVRRLKPRVSGS